eukprot:UN04054
MGESIPQPLEDSDGYRIEEEIQRNLKCPTIRLKRPCPQKTKQMETIQIQIEYTSTIKQLKQKIGSKVGLNTEAFSLCIPTSLKTLDRNELKLSDYGISASNGQLLVVNSKDRDARKRAVPVYVIPLKKELRPRVHTKPFSYQQWINSSMGYNT